jgi:hypothetical protein
MYQKIVLSHPGLNVDANNHEVTVCMQMPGTITPLIYAYLVLIKHTAHLYPASLKINLIEIHLPCWQICCIFYATKQYLESLVTKAIGLITKYVLTTSISQTIGDCRRPYINIFNNLSGRPISTTIIIRANKTAESAIISRYVLIAHLTLLNFKIAVINEPTKLTAIKNTIRNVQPHEAISRMDVT